ncbi:MAG: hypothetical protein IKJ04_06305 [Clostridia bacterium]|nr:hypothetical protein [Clostridia bacterium]MBR4034404.1 hypothetical protein [Clostridia bacterium]
MKRFFKKNKNWLIPVAVILAVCLPIGIGLGAFDGFGDDVKQNTVNEANILKYEDYENVSGEHSGVTVKVLKDGSIKLDGTATADTMIVLTENVNGNGLMTFAALDMGDEAENSYICVGEWDADMEELSTIYGKSSATNYVTFSASTESPAVVLVIESGDSFDEVTLYPVLTYGVVPQTFYTLV